MIRMASCGRDETFRFWMIPGGIGWEERVGDSQERKSDYD
jgi:hypothetical protein